MRTHASWFSGVGGMDMGLHAAGFRTVSLSEIDPYASAVLARHWPEVPNLGDITAVADQLPAELLGRGVPAGGDVVGAGGESGERDGGADPWVLADLWSGGFPCQDLSIAGKRAGFGGDRSVLAFTFLDILEWADRAADRVLGRRHHRAVLLENVPGLLTSAGGADFARLLSEMADIGYGVAWRVLDARFFGVPQRRRRVFILGLRVQDGDPGGRLAAERAGEVLAVWSGGCGHSPQGGAKGKGAAGGAGGGAPVTGLDIAGGLTRRYGKGVNTTIDDGGIVIEREPGGAAQQRLPDPSRRELLCGADRRGGAGDSDGAAPDPDGVRAADGLARQPHGGAGVDVALEPGAHYDGLNQHYDTSGVHRSLRIGRDSSDFVVAQGSLTGGGDDSPQNERVYSAGGLSPTLKSQPGRWGGPGVPSVLDDRVTATHDVVNAIQPGSGGWLGMGDGGDPMVFTQNQRDEVRDLGDLAGQLSASGGSHQTTYVKVSRPSGPDGLGERWAEEATSPTLNSFDTGDSRAVTLVANAIDRQAGGPDDNAAQAGHLVIAGSTGGDLDPQGLDSARYRCCGNGVVAPVAEWIGRRIMQEMEGRA